MDFKFIVNQSVFLNKLLNLEPLLLNFIERMAPSFGSKGKHLLACVNRDIHFVRMHELFTEHIVQPFEHILDVLFRHPYKGLRLSYQDSVL